MPALSAHPARHSASERTLAVAILAADDVSRRRIATILERSDYGFDTSGQTIDGSSSGLDAVVVAGDDLAEAAGVLGAERKLNGSPAVIAVVNAATRAEIETAIADGTAGVVLDATAEEVLALAVRVACLGQIVLPDHFREQPARPTFSDREKQILSMVVLGFRNAEIASRLFLSESTVKTHLSTAFRKLGVRSRKAATAAILDPESGFGYGILGITQATDSATDSQPVDPLPRGTLLASKLRLPAHVVHRSFIRETVILDVRSGTYHKVNATGGRMLEVLNRALSVASAASQLAIEYDRSIAEIEGDICEFATDLLQRGLMEVANGERA